MLAFFAIFRPLTGNKTSPNYLFLVEEVLSFDLVGHMWKSVKDWLQEWVFNIYKWKLGRSRWIAYFENYLQKWFGDRYGEFPTRFSCKISCKIFRKNFPQDFPTRFPARISRKIFLQEFPTRFSHKIFPQDFPELDSDWFLQQIVQHFKIHNVRFHAAFPARFSCKNFPQHFPARISHKNFPQGFPARFSCNNFPQDFPTRISRKIFPSWILIGWLPITLFQMLNFHQSLRFLNWLFPPPPCPAGFSTRFSCNNFPQDFPQQFPARFPTTISSNIFPQDFPTRISRKIFPSWILIGWLPITLFQMLNFHQSLHFLNWLFPPPPCPAGFSTRFSCNNFPQDFLQQFPARFPATISSNIFPQDFPARFSHKNFPQDFPIRFSRKIFP